MAEKTADAYQVALNTAASFAGIGKEGWNARFRQGLAEHGLALSSTPAEGAYPGGRSYQAPAQFDETDGWQQPSFVIWID
jgi:hypothetical protein